MPTPIFQPYVPGINESADGKIRGLTNAYIDMTDYMRHLLSHLDEKNVVRAKAVVADWVYAGNVTTDQLIAGEAKISTAFIEDLEVGRNVTMGPDATISWGKVTGAPSMPTLPGYITSTKITSTTIESPSISGGTITGGTITGVLFKTAASGDRLSMNSSGIISYNSSNNKSGIAIENGEYGYSELNFYQNGMIVGQLMYDSLGGLSLSGLNDVVMHPRGNWDFSEATITGLDAGGTYKFG